MMFLLSSGGQASEPAVHSDGLRYFWTVLTAVAFVGRCATQATQFDERCRKLLSPELCNLRPRICVRAESLSKRRQTAEMIARYFDLLQQRPAVSGYRDVTDFTGVISQDRKSVV